MKKIIALLLSISFSVILAFGFNLLFLDLLERSLVDQLLLMFLSSASLTYIFFSISKEGLLFTEKDKSAFSHIGFSFREYAPGILLALAFFLVYLYFGLQLNRLSAAQVDNLFDADVSSWMRRISGPGEKDFVMRGPHPFAYFVFRPFGWLLNLFTKDPALSAILLNTFTGGTCVFLAWLFIKRHFQNNIYALLIASVLGLSTSHFFFGSVVETYIFSALALILFFLLLEADRQSIFPLVFAGVLTFGITITNFVQAVIVFIVNHPRWKEIFRFLAWTISLSIILSVLHAAVYPSSKLFFLLTSTKVERKFFNILLKMPAWKAVGRIIFLVRTVFLYTMVAPDVYILREEVGSSIPEFRFFKIVPGTFSYSGYDGVGTVLVLIWGIMLMVAGLMFLRSLIRTRKGGMMLAFVLCLLFNFILHANYGQELFLYSPDWAYALTFFVAFGLASFRENRYFQIGMFIFLLLLAYNQWHFMNVIINELLPYM
ncbi:MAG: hypothetical protein IH588_16950 [Anaerolineales bacterium]|nr:hypothetical protein [Anaerolineales bacterium]